MFGEQEEVILDSNLYKTQMSSGFIFLLSEWHLTLFSWDMHWSCDDFAPIPGILAEGVVSHHKLCYVALHWEGSWYRIHPIFLFHVFCNLNSCFNLPTLVRRRRDTAVVIFPVCVQL